MLWVLLVSLLGLNNEQVSAPSLIPFQNMEGDLSDIIFSTLEDEQKVGQLLIWQATPGMGDEVTTQVAQQQLGGVLLDNWTLADFSRVLNACRQNSPIPLFTAANGSGLLNCQLADAPSFLQAESQAALDPHGRALIRALYNLQLGASGLNFVIGNDDLQAHREWRDQRLLAALTLNDIDQPGLTPNAAQVLAGQGTAGILIDYRLIEGAADKEINWLANKLQEEWGYDGILLTQLPPGKEPINALLAGVDLVISPEAHALGTQILCAVESGKLPIDLVDQKVRKTLKAKQWMRGGLMPPISTEKQPPIQASISGSWGKTKIPNPKEDPDSLLDAHFNSRRWDYLTYKMFERTVTLANNHRGLLPLKELSQKRFRMLELSEKPFRYFREYFGKYADANSLLQPPATDGTLPPLPLVSDKEEVQVVLLESEKVDWARDLPFIQSLQDMARQTNVILVNFGDPQNLQFFDSTLTVVQVYERNEITEATTAQLLFGALSAQGRLPFTVNPSFPVGTSISTPVTRLKYGRPEEVGISPEKLVGIDAIARTAIQDRATPGCQVVVAKGGKIIYHKSFGWHTFDKSTEVKENHLYDLASITKAAATTLSTMKLYETDGLDLESRLHEVIPCDPGASVGKIPLRKLMTHESGLQPHMPVLSYLRYRTENNAACDSFFCEKPSYQYSLQVANRFYFDKRYKDSIWANVNQLPVSLRKRYKYSDVNFVLMQRVVETQSMMPLDAYARQHFYGPLGLRRTDFRPVYSHNRNEIVPTQRDTRWRKQLVHGFVHDETAAIFGGVAGHAGLFSTAEEITVLFQMLLNGGSYGGAQFLQPETIDYFTSKQGNHRGLGFDKPSATYYKAMAKEAPATTFGHTGFTGTCVWADPDNDLIYVFLSNRIHPSVRNRTLFKNRVRERIHQVVYDALGSYQERTEELPTLIKGG